MCKVLLTHCTKKKARTTKPLPALQMYKGSTFKSINKMFKKKGRPKGLKIKILSALYCLIDENQRIKKYNVKFNRKTAEKARAETTRRLKKMGIAPDEIFVHLNGVYLSPVSEIKKIFPKAKFIYAKRGKQERSLQLKKWFESLYSPETKIKKGAKK